MKLLGPKRRKAFRLTVYILTALCIIGIPASIFTPQRLIMEYTGKSKVRWNLEIMLYNGRFRIGGFRVYHMYAKPKLSMHFAQRKHIRSTVEWWRPPRTSYTKLPSASMQVITRLSAQIPLVYFAVLLSAGSWWLWKRNHRRSLPGHCVECNYNLAGLESPTCPECGAIHA